MNSKDFLLLLLLLLPRCLFALRAPGSSSLRRRVAVGANDDDKEVYRNPLTELAGRVLPTRKESTTSWAAPKRPLSIDAMRSELDAGL
jgi:hypothetical protein